MFKTAPLNTSILVVALNANVLPFANEHMVGEQWQCVQSVPRTQMVTELNKKQINYNYNITKKN